MPHPLRWREVLDKWTVDGWKEKGRQDIASLFSAHKPAGRRGCGTGGLRNGVYLPALSHPSPGIRRGTPSVGCWELTELIAAA